MLRAAVRDWKELTKKNRGRRTNRSTLLGKNAPVQAQARGEVEACLEKQFGI